MKRLLHFVVSCFALSDASPKGGAWLRLLACAASGALGGLVFTYHQILWPLTFVFLLPFLLAFFSHADRFGSCFGYALTYSFSYYIVLMGWLGEMKEMIFWGIDPDLADLTVVAAILGVSLIESTLTALILSLFALVRRGKWWDAFAFAGLFVLSENAMEYMGDLTFSWGRLAHLAAPLTPFLQSASLFGSLFLSLLILLINSGIAMAMLHWHNFSARRAAALLAAGLMTANLTFGTLRMAVLKQQPPNQPFGVLLVQGNFGGGNKWLGSSDEMLEQYLALSQAGLQQHPDTCLVIWPETAVVKNLTSDTQTLQQLEQFAAAQNITLVTGAFSSSDDPDRDLNSAWVFTPDGVCDRQYSKQVLVPMGEVIPFRDWFEALMPWLFTGDILLEECARGEGTVVNETPCGNLGTLICYESIVPHIVRQNTEQGADVLVMITNDSWFGASAALEEHLSHAKLRAVENGCCLLRAANTGISALVQSDGSVTARTAVNEQTVLYGTAARAQGRTLYSYTGDLIGPLAFLYLTALWIVLLCQKRKGSLA